MARLEIYLTDAEKLWLERQPRGWLRMILQRYMAKYPERVPEARAEAHDD